MDILIFDDDTNFAELLFSFVRESGFQAEKYYDGSRALERILDHQPRLVILDIMMPGMDGLNICRAVKADPRTAGIKVLIASSKAYAQDREAAKRCGADGFVLKPVDFKKFHETLLGYLDSAGRPSAAAKPRQAAFRVRIWGSHGPAGEDAAPSPTSCCTLEFGDRLVVLDAGSGLRQAVQALKALPAPMAQESWLLISHYHEDHVGGMPALQALFGPEHSLKIAGPADPGLPLREVVQNGLLGDEFRAKVQLYALSESRFQLWPDVSVSTMLVRHPGLTMAYRFEHKGRCLVYCPDNELEPEEGVATDFTEKFARFVRAADLLIHDACYLDDDYPAHAGEGHGSPRRAVELAVKEGVRRLGLFHMKASYLPSQLEPDLARIRRNLGSDFSSLAVDWALPGAVFDV